MTQQQTMEILRSLTDEQRALLAALLPWITAARCSN